MVRGKDGPSHFLGLQGHSALYPEVPDSGADELLDYAPRAQPPGYVPYKRPEVCPLGDHGPNHGSIALQLQKLQLVNVNPLGLHLNPYPLPGQGVEALPLDPNRRVGGRYLLDFPDKVLQHLGKLLFGKFRNRRPPDDLALGVQGVGLDPQLNGGHVLLLEFGYEGQEFSRPSQAHDQDPGGVGVQGAGVPGLADPQNPLHLVDGLGRGYPLGLV